MATQKAMLSIKQQNQIRKEQILSSIGLDESRRSEIRQKAQSVKSQASIKEAIAEGQQSEGTYMQESANRKKDQGIGQIAEAITYLNLAEQLMNSEDSGDKARGQGLFNLGNLTQGIGQGNVDQGQDLRSQGVQLMSQGTSNAIMGAVLAQGGEDANSDLLKVTAAIQASQGQLDGIGASILADDLGDQLDTNKQLTKAVLGSASGILGDNMNQGNQEMYRALIGAGVNEGVKSLSGASGNKEIADQAGNMAINLLNGNSGMVFAETTLMSGLQFLDEKDKSFIEDSGALDITLGHGFNNEERFRQGLGKALRSEQAAGLVSEDAAPFLVNADKIAGAARSVQQTGLSGTFENIRNAGVNLNGNSGAGDNPSFLGASLPKSASNRLAGVSSRGDGPNGNPFRVLPDFDKTVEDAGAPSRKFGSNLLGGS